MNELCRVQNLGLHVIYNNAAQLFIYEGQQRSHMRKTLP